MTVFGQQLNLSKGRFFSKIGKVESRRASSPFQPNLASSPSGSQVEITELSLEIPVERRSQLVAYGLTQGARVRIIQHSPVTVIQIEHMELALESDLAKLVQVQYLA